MDKPAMPQRMKSLRAASAMGVPMKSQQFNWASGPLGTSVLAAE